MPPESSAGSLLDAALALDHEDPGFWRWAGDVLVPGVSVAQPARRQTLDPLLAVLPVVHVDGAVEDNENLRPVVDVPHVGLIGPVQPHRGVLDLRDVQCAPRGAGR